MQDEQQFEQLMMQYQQLKNGAEDISRLIDSELFDDAITMIKSRENVFLNCKNIRQYLELTPVQQKEVDKIFNEIRNLELTNIKKLENNMEEIQREIKLSQQSQKLQHAYDGREGDSGNIVNIEK